MDFRINLSIYIWKKAKFVFILEVDCWTWRSTLDSAIFYSMKNQWWFRCPLINSVFNHFPKYFCVFSIYTLPSSYQKVFLSILYFDLDKPTMNGGFLSRVEVWPATTHWCCASPKDTQFLKKYYLLLWVFMLNIMSFRLKMILLLVFDWFLFCPIELLTTFSMVLTGCDDNKHCWGN